MVVIPVFYSSTDRAILDCVENLSLLLEPSIRSAIQDPIVVAVKVISRVIAPAIKHIFTPN